MLSLVPAEETYGDDDDSQDKQASKKIIIMKSQWYRKLPQKKQTQGLMTHWTNSRGWQFALPVECDVKIVVVAVRTVVVETVAVVAVVRFVATAVVVEAVG
jgi:hypothetical protein